MHALSFSPTPFTVLQPLPPLTPSSAPMWHASHYLLSLLAFLSFTLRILTLPPWLSFRFHDLHLHTYVYTHTCRLRSRIYRWFWIITRLNVLLLPPFSWKCSDFIFIGWDQSPLSIETMFYLPHSCTDRQVGCLCVLVNVSTVTVSLDMFIGYWMEGMYVFIGVQSPVCPSLETSLSHLADCFLCCAVALNYRPALTDIYIEIINKVNSRVYKRTSRIL